MHKSIIGVKLDVLDQLAVRFLYRFIFLGFVPRSWRDIKYNISCDVIQ